MVVKTPKFQVGDRIYHVTKEKLIKEFNECN